MRFYLKKIGFYLVALFAALTLNFAIPRLMPGDPVSAVLTRLASRGGTVAPETREAITAMLGQGGGNIFQQYIDYLKNIFTGNWGVSVTYFPNQVTTSIASALPWTICLVGTTTIISFFVQQALGIWAGWRRGGALITSFPLCPPFSKLFLTSGLHSSSFGCLPVRCIGSLSQADTIIVRLCLASLGNSSRAQCSMQSCRP